MNQKELNKILKQHKLWVDGKGGAKADLSYTDLNGANLRGANLKNTDLRDAYLIGADLSYANLSGADLSRAKLRVANLKGANLLQTDLPGAGLNYADLRDADLSGSNLTNAYLIGADLSGADLHGAKLRYANLSYANLSGADLSGANLRYANLTNANLNDIITEISTSFFFLQCPEVGSFIGYKKCRGGVIVTLKILASAKRSSATSRSCRCNKAKVLKIEDKSGNEIFEAFSVYDENFKYETGKTVEVKDFDKNRWVGCSTGIHFFITKEEAKKY